MLMFPGPLDAMLRSLALSQYGYYGNKDTIAKAQQLFARHVSKEELIPANLQEVVFGICMETGDHYTFDQLIQVWCCLGAIFNSLDG